MHAKRTLRVVEELEFRRHKRGLAMDKLAEYVIFHQHLGEKIVSRETKEKRVVLSGHLNDDIRPPCDDVTGRHDILFGDDSFDDPIQVVIHRKKFLHTISSFPSDIHVVSTLHSRRVKTGYVKSKVGEKENQSSEITNILSTQNIFILPPIASNFPIVELSAEGLNTPNRDPDTPNPPVDHRHSSYLRFIIKL
jgi:hypothetical protein